MSVNRASTLKPHKITGFLLFLFAIAIISLLAFSTTINWQLISDENTAKNHPADTEILDLMDNLNLTREGRAVFLANQPKFVDSNSLSPNCRELSSKNSLKMGCYYSDESGEHIEIYAQPSSQNPLDYDFEAQYRTVALHETLHAVYARLNANEQASVCANLKSFASETPSLQNELKYYTDDHLCTELFARTGSEFLPNAAQNYYSASPAQKQILAQLAPIYAKYFNPDNANYSASYWESQAKITQLEQNISELSAQLSTQKASISAQKAEYATNPTSALREEINAQVATYNQTSKQYNNYLDIAEQLQNQIGATDSILLDK